jgi:myo-inositol-1-phosphate synthase
VHIDYYPPRGDAKEAWDVIDFSGILGLPMSLRLNLQGRDSILAAPMVIDLARWVTALHMAGIGGPVGELGFFFKKPVGENPGLTFQDQLLALDRLEQRIGAALDGPGISG